MQTSRREVLALSHPALPLRRLTATAWAQELKKVRVGKAIISSFPFSDSNWRQARHLEIGRAQCRDIHLPGRRPVAAGPGRRSIDFRLRVGPGMGYAAKGVPAHAVAAVANRPANMALVVAKGSGVTRIGDLKGKRIGVSTRGR